MNRSTTLNTFPLADSAPAAARAVFQLMKRLKHGSLDVHMPDGTSARFGSATGMRARPR